MYCTSCASKAASCRILWWARGLLGATLASAQPENKGGGTRQHVPREFRGSLPLIVRGDSEAKGSGYGQLCVVLPHPFPVFLLAVSGLRTLPLKRLAVLRHSPPPPFYPTGPALMDSVWLLRGKPF